MNKLRPPEQFTSSSHPPNVPVPVASAAGAGAGAGGADSDKTVTPVKVKRKYTARVPKDMSLPPSASASAIAYQSAAATVPKQRPRASPHKLEGGGGGMTSAAVYRGAGMGMGTGGMATIAPALQRIFDHFWELELPRDVSVPFFVTITRANCHQFGLDDYLDKIFPNESCSLQTIKSKLGQQGYHSFELFELDFMTMFDNAIKYYNMDTPQSITVTNDISPAPHRHQDIIIIIIISYYYYLSYSHSDIHPQLCILHSCTYGSLHCAIFKLVVCCMLLGGAIEKRVHANVC